MRSKGRSRPMSATLTPERKSARDRPASSKKRGGLGRESGRLTEVLVVSRPARIRVQIHTPKGSIGPPCLAGPARSCCNLSLMPFSSARARLVRRRLSLRDRCCTAARGAARHRRHASLCCSLSCAKSTSAAAPMAYCRHLCHARTRMREIWCVGGVWRALGEHVLDRFAVAAPAALLMATRMIDVPLSGPKRQNSSEKGRARSMRGAGGRQTLQTPWPIKAALARAPDRSRRRPGAVLHCHTVVFVKKSRSW